VGTSVGGGASVGGASSPEATAVRVALTLFSTSWGSVVGAGSLVALLQAASTRLTSKIMNGKVLRILLSPQYVNFPYKWVQKVILEISIYH
jgi:hypothetical protein